MWYEWYVDIKIIYMTKWLYFTIQSWDTANSYPIRVF